MSNQNSKDALSKDALSKDALSKDEEGSYIFGTERAELHRLGLQHQVWASEARNGWDFAQFGNGQTILDLGCGPGFCTRDLSYMVGSEGKVIGVDKSKIFIDFLDKTAELHGLDIQTICSDFDSLMLPDESLDGVYNRWVLSWINNPEEVIAKVAKAMKPGGTIVSHEYYDWGTLQTEPQMPALSKGIQAALSSFAAMDGEVNIGKQLPSMFYDAGLEVIRVRPMSKMTTTEDLTWQWPRTFFEIYMPKLVEPGFLTSQDVQDVFSDFEALESIEGATLFSPIMVEVVAVKP